MGIKGMRVTRQEDLAEKMKEFIEYEGPVLMEAVVTKGEHVLPMVPAGKALHQFLVHGIVL
jgi:acetolactate synthase-1/2/3 large subunit